MFPWYGAKLQVSSHEWFVLGNTDIENSIRILRHLATLTWTVTKKSFVATKYCPLLCLWNSMPICHCLFKKRCCIIRLPSHDIANFSRSTHYV